MENEYSEVKVVNNRIIVYNSQLPPSFWNEWNNVCGKLNAYFDEIRMRDSMKEKHTKPRYRDSHSVVY